MLKKRKKEVMDETSKEYNQGLKNKVVRELAKSITLNIPN